MRHFHHQRLSTTVPGVTHIFPFPIAIIVNMFNLFLLQDAKCWNKTAWALEAGALDETRASLALTLTTRASDYRTDYNPLKRSVLHRLDGRKTSKKPN